MLTLSRFQEIKNLYGGVASWAIWGTPKKGTSDTSDLSPFGDSEIGLTLPKLHTRIILVALNISGPLDRPLSNFHGGSRDFMLRDAVAGTMFEGAYMTDLIKNYEDKNAASVVKFFRANKSEFDQHVKFFLEELEFVGATKKSVLVALGGDAYQLLSSANLSFEVEKLSHYSARTLGKERYRNEVSALASSIGSAI